jgi:predicted permease
MTTIRHHLRQALRTWRSTPGLAITAILTIALGIGVNATVLGLVEALVLRPLPAVSDAARIVTTTRNPFSYPAYRVFASRQRMFERMAVWQQLSLNLVADGRAERARGLVVSGLYFETLGVRAFKGRMLTAADDELGDRVPAVLSTRPWRTRFDAREDIIGRQITLNRQFVTVVGIAPEGFEGTDLAYPADVFVPITAHDVLARAGGGRPALASHEGGWLRATGRLRAGGSIAAAQAGADRLLAEMVREMPAFRTTELVFVPLNEAAFPGGSRRTATTGLLAVLALAACVLLVACANVANLLLARGETRRQEFGVRLALGSGRWRLISQLLTETLVLVACATGTAVLIAQWALAALATTRLTAHTPISLSGVIDLRVMAAVALAALTATAACGVVPAIHAGRTNLQPLLGRAADVPARRRFGIREALIAVQVGASVALMVGAVLFLATLRNQEALSPGFQAEGVAFARLHVGLAGHARASGEDVFRRLVERLESHPAVVTASRAINTPLGAVAYVRAMARPGDSEALRVQNNVVAPGYFCTLGVSLVEGSDFGPGSPAGSVIVNETLARQLWPGGSAVGQLVEAKDRGSRMSRIIGVVKDTKSETLQDGRVPFVYTHLADDYDARQVVFVRGRGDATPLLAVLREAAQRTDPTVPVIDLTSMSDHVASTLSQPRAVARLVTLLAALAAALAAVGLYGVLTFTVSTRRRDLAIRIALGATRREVVAAAVSRASVAVVAGLAGGVAAAAGLGRFVASLLFGVRPADPWVLATAVLMALGVGIAAGIGPVMRAMKTPPAMALRE